MAHPEVRPGEVTPPVGAGPRGHRRARGVLGVRFGFNPNSSSLGIDISFLMMGLAGVSVISAAASAFLHGVGSKSDREASGSDDDADR
ncbi:MAG: hypothetical protein ACE366_07850 [Bradymonadia bacterium]